MPSRRELLAGAAGVAGVAALGVAHRVRLGAIETQSPAPDTWPLRRFDAANTAATVDADPPTDPSVAWTANPLRTGYPVELVVGRERVYAATAGRVVALDRADGRERWRAEGGRPLALHDDTLYVAPGDLAPRIDEPTLRALDASTGDPRWTTPTRSEGTSVLATDDLVLVGGERALEAFDPPSGRRRWSSTGVTEALPLVHRGHLYTADGQFDGRVCRYRPRRLADVPTGTSPSVAWQTDHPGIGRSLTARGDAIVAGFRVGHDGSGPAWTCLDAADGATRWTGAERQQKTAVGPLAVSVGRCVAGVGAAVVARRLTDGHVDWRVSLDAEPRDVAVAGGTAVVASAAGTVRAVDMTTGVEQWRVDPGVTPAVLAPVDDALFVGSPGGQVVALR